MITNYITHPFYLLLYSEILSSQLKDENHFSTGSVFIEIQVHQVGSDVTYLFRNLPVIDKIHDRLNRADINR